VEFNADKLLDVAFGGCSSLDVKACIWGIRCCSCVGSGILVTPNCDSISSKYGKAKSGISSCSYSSSKYRVTQNGSYWPLC